MQVHAHWHDWVVYICAAVLTMAYKAARYVRYKKEADSGMTTGHAILDWFFENSAENVASWTGSIGAILVMGAVYLDKLGIGLQWFQDLPVHWSLAFFLGAINEMWAPNLAKWVVNKIPGGGELQPPQGGQGGGWAP